MSGGEYRLPLQANNTPIDEIGVVSPSRTTECYIPFINLIILYGPPAVGKLTVGKQLSRLTRYPLLHNHPTVDLIQTVYPFGNQPFNRLNRSFRLMLLKFALAEKLPGLIMTYVWASNSSSDNAFIRRLIQLVRRAGGRTYLIGLTSPEAVLPRRVGNADRRAFGKLHRKNDLLRLLPRWEMQNSVRRTPRPTLTIDTSRLKPKKAAESIVRHCQLKKMA